MRDVSWKNNVTLKINQRNFENFVNECMKESICLKSVKKEDDFFWCTMSFADFKRIRPIVRKTGVRIHIAKKSGALYFTYIHRRRYGFYLGAVMALCILVYLTSCIWVVDVTGNDTTGTKEILKVMEKNGISVGAFRYGKKISDIKNSALIELDTLSWLWVTIDGTRAEVEVREKGESTQIVDKTKPCNLVATYPGVIYDMQVRSGRKVIARGDTVSEGQLLVSGVTETAYRSDRYIYSSGTVTARTWRTEEGEFNHKNIKKIKTGKSKTRYKINLFGKDINLHFGGKVKFKDYIEQSRSTQARLFTNIYLPITFTTEEFYEIITKEEVLSDDALISQAVKSLTDKILSKRADGATTVKRTYGYDTLANGNLHVTVTIESIENIAGQVGIDIQKAEDNILGEDN